MVGALLARSPPRRWAPWSWRASASWWPSWPAPGARAACRGAEDARRDRHRARGLDALRAIPGAPRTGLRTRHQRSGRPVLLANELRRRDHLSERLHDDD